MQLKKNVASELVIKANCFLERSKISNVKQSEESPLKCIYMHPKCIQLVLVSFPAKYQR